MSRPQPGKSRVTPKKGGSQTSNKKGAATVELKSRNPEKKAEDFNQLLEQQKTEPEPEVEKPEPVTEFLYNGKTFKFTDPDEDVLGAMSGFAIFSSDAEASDRLLKLVFASPAEHARFITELNNDIEKVLANRKQWKEDGSDPDDEPIGVTEFFTGVVKDVLKIFKGSLGNDPKGRG